MKEKIVCILVSGMTFLSLYSCSKISEWKPTAKSDYSKEAVISSLGIINGDKNDEIIPGEVNQNFGEVIFNNLSPQIDFHNLEFVASMPEGAYLESNVFDVKFPEDSHETEVILKVVNGKNSNKYKVKLNKKNPNLINSDFKIVGYFPIRRAMTMDLSQMKLDKLTDVNLYPVALNDQGEFDLDFSALKEFINTAHDKGVRVFISLMADDSPGGYHPFLKNDKRPQLIEKLTSIVVDNDLDGIDVDLEAGYARGADYDPNLSPFVIELSQELKANNKLITAALGGQYPGNGISAAALNSIDYVNVMSYDHTGPWYPDKKINHSSYEESILDITPYLEDYGLAKEKVILGLPFYGYAFGQGTDEPVQTWYYNSLISDYPEASIGDQWTLPNGYILYYNGIPTIKKKVRLAKEMAGGVMIWMLTFDTESDKTSLLHAIYEESPLSN